MENQETFWVVWREGDRAPVVKHETFTAACLEADRLSKENPGAKFHVLVSCGLFYVEPDPIRRVFEQYRHVDKLISNERWGIFPGAGSAPHFLCLKDLWQAIKESQEGKATARCSCRNHPRYGVERDDECPLHGDRE